MAYIKNNWVDQSVERPKTYEMTNNADGSVTLIDSFGLVSELGTPVNADNMNHIEEGVEGCAIRKHNLAEVFEDKEWVTSIVGGEKKLFQSKKDNNQGHAVSEADWWEELIFGGSGGGLEVGDIGMALYVDETKGLRRYLNGSIVAINSNTQGFLNRLLQIKALHPSLFTTEENWQAEKTVSAFGQVGKFVLNYASDGVTVESVRLPAVVNAQGLFDLQNLGMTVSAGLPSIPSQAHTHYIARNEQVNSSHASLDSSNYLSYGSSGGGNGYVAYVLTGTGNIANIGKTSGAITSGSTNNDVYGQSDTVQPEAIQYPYFIQIATGSETEADIVNEIELNNPFSLLDYKYSEYELNNLSWLRSNDQYNSKALYPAVYDLLLKIYNGTETKAGVSVKLSTETFTDTDFVLNTTDETFRLPLKVKQKFFIGGDVAVVGNGKALGLTDGSTNFVMMSSVTGISNYVSNLCLATNTSANAGASVQQSTNVTNKAIGVSKSSSNSGLVAKLSNSEATGLYLYFYVGETVQNANLIDAGRIEEQLIKKTDTAQAAHAAMPSERYIDLTLGASGAAYTAPADGYFYLRAQNSSGTTKVVRLQYATGTNKDMSALCYGTSAIAAYIPAKTGRQVYAFYDSGINDFIFRFYYAEGVQ